MARVHRSVYQRLLYVRVYLCGKCGTTLKQIRIVHGLCVLSEKRFSENHQELPEHRSLMARGAPDVRPSK